MKEFIKNNADMIVIIGLGIILFIIMGGVALLVTGTHY